MLGARIMRWVWRFAVYFVKPLLVWYIVCYFGYQSIRAVASAFLSYEREVRRAETAARREAADAGASDRGTNHTHRVKAKARKGTD